MTHLIGQRNAVPLLLPPQLQLLALGPFRHIAAKAPSARATHAQQNTRRKEKPSVLLVKEGTREGVFVCTQAHVYNLFRWQNSQ